MSTPLLDAAMPRWDVVERHATRVRAPATRAYHAVRTADLAGSGVVKLLFALRSLPALVATGGRAGLGRPGATLDGLQRSGFVLLAEEPGREIVLGIVGRFWRPSGGVLKLTADEWRAFDRPGYAVGAWNFAVESAGAAECVITTETRVRCTDAASLRRFRAYWLVVGPFSALIRREMLRTLRRAAEQAS